MNLMSTKPESRKTQPWSIISVLGLAACIVLLGLNATAQWLAHSHDEQHTALSTIQSQPLAKIHWHTPVDLFPPQGEIFIHYGSPLVTAANTVIVPVKTGTNTYRVEAHNGATGKRLWLQSTHYQAPGASFIPGLGPAISGNQLFVPDLAGRVLVRQNPDLAKGATTHLTFYGQKNYARNPTAYQQNVQIDTPLTIDASGNLYFGFLVLGATPLNLQGGIARITPAGTATWISAAVASGDASISQVAISAAPALSPDGSLLYVAVDNGTYGYLLALNSTTLALVSRVRLTDPSSGLDAQLCDCSSATPTVGPDGDVYFGVLENPFPNHNDRGWLLHFSGDLSKTRIPGSFGWDDTASIVPASLVSSYHGTSNYLLMTKYNNYGGIGTGDGHNRIAIRTPDMRNNIHSLSGGNQQKALFARALASDARIILLDDPTRGVDVATRQEVYDLIRSETRNGRTFLWYTTEVDELMHCDHIYVFRNGAIVANLARSELSEEKVIHSSFQDAV